MNSIAAKCLIQEDTENIQTVFSDKSRFFTIGKRPRWFGLLSIVIIIFSLMFFFRVYSTYQPQGHITETRVRGNLVRSLEVETGHELMEQLKMYDLWDIQPDSEIPPIVLASFPDNFEQLEVNNKKRAFFHSLLPVAMIALSEIESERDTVEYILNKLRAAGISGKIDFSDNDGAWTVILDSVELDFLRDLTAKYRTSDSQVLLKRVNVIPISLIMAQGAIESSWGSSRFALEGNNLFGIWTWGKKGIIPALREEGLNHKVASYPSILESVRDYILVLNRHQAYTKFRDLRKQSLDSMTLVDGLIKYSERREDYIRDVKRMIRSNQLQRFDSYLLTSQLEDPDGLMNIMFLRKNLNAVI